MNSSDMSPLRRMCPSSNKVPSPSWAKEKSEIAPTRRARAPASLSTSSGSTMLGWLVSSRSQPVDSTRAATSSMLAVFMCRMVSSPRLEADVEARGPVLHLRLRLEVAGREVVLGEGVDLRVYAGVVGDGPEVARRERQAQPAGPEPPGPVVRCKEGQRQLAQLDEPGRLEVAPLGGLEEHRLGLGLFLQRCGLVHRPAAVEHRGAAEGLDRV